MKRTPQSLPLTSMCALTFAYLTYIHATYITHPNKRMTVKKNHFITEPVYTKAPIYRIVLLAVAPRTLHGWGKASTLTVTPILSSESDVFWATVLYNALFHDPKEAWLSPDFVFENHSYPIFWSSEVEIQFMSEYVFFFLHSHFMESRLANHS